MQESLVFLGNPNKSKPIHRALASQFLFTFEIAARLKVFGCGEYFNLRTCRKRGRRKGRSGSASPASFIRHIYHDNPKGTTPLMPTLPKMEGLSTTIIYTLQVLALEGGGSPFRCPWMHDDIYCEGCRFQDWHRLVEDDLFHWFESKLIMQYCSTV